MLSVEIGSRKKDNKKLKTVKVKGRKWPSNPLEVEPFTSRTIKTPDPLITTSTSEQEVSSCLLCSNTTTPTSKSAPQSQKHLCDCSSHSYTQANVKQFLQMSLDSDNNQTLTFLQLAITFITRATGVFRQQWHCLWTPTTVYPPKCTMILRQAILL